MSKPFSLKKTSRTNLLLTTAGVSNTDTKSTEEGYRQDFARGSVTEKIECEKINAIGGGGVRGMVKKIGRKTRISTEKNEQLNANASPIPTSTCASTTTNSSASTSAATSPFSTSSPTIASIPKRAPSIKHRWLLTRKTWRYMSDAGKRLIPESIHSSSSASASANSGGTTNKDDIIPKIEEYFQDVCRNEQKFLLWRRKSSYPGAISSLRRKKQLQRRKNNTNSNNKQDPQTLEGETGGNLRWEKQNQQKLQRPNNEYQIIINMLENLLNSDGDGIDDSDENENLTGIVKSLQSGSAMMQRTDIDSENNNCKNNDNNNNSTNIHNKNEMYEVSNEIMFPLKSPDNIELSPSLNSSTTLLSTTLPIPGITTTTTTATTAATTTNSMNTDAQRSTIQDLSIWHSSNYDLNADKTNNIYTNILLDSLRQYRKKNYSPYLMSMAQITPELLNDRPLLRKILRDIKQQQQINKMSANLLIRNDSCMSLNLPLSTTTLRTGVSDDLNFNKWNSKEGLSSSNNLSSSANRAGESMTKLISTKLLNKNREERMKFLTGNNGSSSTTNFSSNVTNTTTTTTTSLSYEQQQQIRYYKQQQQQNFIIKNSHDNYLKFNANANSNTINNNNNNNNQSSMGSSLSNSGNVKSTNNKNTSSDKLLTEQPPLRVICKQQQQQKLYQHTTTTAVKLKPLKLSAVNISLTTASTTTTTTTTTNAATTTGGTSVGGGAAGDKSGIIIKTSVIGRNSGNKSQMQSSSVTSSTAGLNDKNNDDSDELISVPTSRQFGTQTNTIPLRLLQEWLKVYKTHIAELEKQQADDRFYNQQQAEQQSSNSGDDHNQQQNPAHHRRKSSLDNEDISQSVSDTIKRYLRMARKAKPNQEQANRFKRVNYDRNLRNIKAKGEITMPGDDDGNSKGVQTEENWLLVLFNDLNQLNSVAETESTSHSSASFPSQSSSSQPHQSILQTSTQFLTNLLWHTSPPSSSNNNNNNNNNNSDSIEDQLIGTQEIGSTRNAASATGTQQVMVGETPIVMQKSKSSSNVGHLVSKKIWKTRSKSQTRASITPSPTLIANTAASPQQSVTPEVPVKAQWVPQGKGIWKDERRNRCIQLTNTLLKDLTPVEREILQKISLEKIAQLNFDLNVILPVEDYSAAASNVSAVQPKPQKRRALLLKRKALTTGFFDNGKGAKDDANHTGDNGELGGGHMFGISLQKCIENDQKRLNRTKGTDKSGATPQQDKQQRTSRSSLSSLSDKSESLETLNRQTSLSQTDIWRRLSDDIVIPFIEPNESSDIRSFGDIIDKKSNINIPLIVLICIKYIETNGLNTIGIFRVGTSKRRVRLLRENFDNGMMTIDNETCPHDIATLLKEFLRDLPDPLLCHSLYVAFIKTQTIRNRRLQLEAISHLIKLLPPTHADTLYCLLKFLSNIAAHCDDVRSTTATTGESFSGSSYDDEGLIRQGNKMDSSNLATVIAPNILRSLTTNPEDNSDVINVIRTMIDHYVDLFIIHSYVIDEIYTHMLDTNPRELDLLCDRRLMMLMMLEMEPTAALHYFSLPKKDADETKRRIYSRDEFLHENAAKGGPNISMRRNTGSSSGGDLIRRRRRHNTNDLLEMTIATSAGVSGIMPGKTRSSSIDSNSSMSQGFFETTTPSSSSAASSLSLSRRLSTPNTIGGIVKASLKIPVHTIQTTTQQQQQQITHNLGDDILDIPYIEEMSGSGGNSMSMMGDYESVYLHKQLNRRHPNKRDDSLTNAITGSLSLMTAGGAGGCSTSTNASISSDHGISTGYDDLIFSSIATSSSGATTTSPPSSSSPLSQCSTPDTLRSSSNNSSSYNNPQQFFNLDDMRNLLISMPQSSSASAISINKDKMSTNRSEITSPKAPIGTDTAEKPKKPSIKKSIIAAAAATIANPNSTHSILSPPPQFKQHQTNINEQKWTPSITNIGGAVLRSKTADFERLLGGGGVGGSTSVNKGNRTNSAVTLPSSTIAPIASTTTIPQVLTSSVSASNIGGTSNKKTPIYKRQELISSVQHLPTKSKK